MKTWSHEDMPTITGFSSRVVPESGLAVAEFLAEFNFTDHVLVSTCLSSVAKSLFFAKQQNHRYLIVRQSQIVERDKPLSWRIKTTVENNPPAKNSKQKKRRKGERLMNYFLVLIEIFHLGKVFLWNNSTTSYAISK